jgi:hypothetical protein
MLLLCLLCFLTYSNCSLHTCTPFLWLISQHCSSRPPCNPFLCHNHILILLNLCSISPHVSHIWPAPSTLLVEAFIRYAHYAPAPCHWWIAPLFVWPLDLLCRLTCSSLVPASSSCLFSSRLPASARLLSERACSSFYVLDYCRMCPSCCLPRICRLSLFIFFAGTRLYRPSNKKFSSRCGIHPPDYRSRGLRKAGQLKTRSKNERIIYSVVAGEL